ncbi:MAG: ribosomal RNA small subunit methyltransferase A, partial [Myxococcales bacterium]|nr:ribosomal RNA small subunit methyltransferase A [Myxococcales bacterium]
RYGLAPHRDRGQNFLVEPAVAQRLVELSGVGAEETAIEVGAGFGMLTRALAARARRVLAIEVDAGLVRALRAEGLPPNVTLEHADARKIDFAARAEALPGPVRVVANLPYSVATPLLRNLLDARGSLAGWSVMVQKEVAARLNAPTGGASYGSLSVLHSLLVTVRRGLDLRPGCFFPVPAVSSSFVCFEPRTDVEISASELNHLERLLRGAFRRRRKTVWNALRGAGFPEEGVRAALAAAGLEQRLRPQQIPPEAWLEFSRRPEIGNAARSAEEHDREKGQP